MEEINKASNTFMDAYKKMIKDDNKEGIGELDAIINASKADC